MSRPDSETTRFYESHVRRYGYGYRALGFGRRSSQEKRFGALAALGSFDGARILDVGCGFGDLLGWLRARGVQPRYTGLDFTESMIERCRKRFPDAEARFPEGSARFIVGDALTWQADGEYDYVIASGIFGYNAKDTRARSHASRSPKPQPTSRMRAPSKLPSAASAPKRFSCEERRPKPSAR